MRLVSFNILEGLRPTPADEAERRRLDRERAEAAKEVVADLDPDILVLNEALFCRAYEGRHVDYANLFGYQHEASALYGGSWGNAILSRHPISASQEFRIYNRGGLRATINAPSGRLSLASYHPHPHRYPENKARDFAELVAGVRGPLIVCGDLNSISPEDVVDRAALEMAFRDFADNPKEVVGRFIDSGAAVFAELAALGLRDAVPAEGRRYSIPTDLINPDKRSGIRIDHILANEMIKVISGEVVHSAASNRASDHHPVMIEFEIEEVRLARN